MASVLLWDFFQKLPTFLLDLDAGESYLAKYRLQEEH
jgi:hypothetical protein